MLQPSSDSPDGFVPTGAGYAPYGQLVKMLLPSAGSIAIYDALDELLWCSDGYERPDLRALLESMRSENSEMPVGRGSVRTTAAGVPSFVAALRDEDARPLGSLVVELGQGPNTRYAGTMVVSLLRPVLDCLESQMNLEHTVLRGGDREDHASLDLLLTVDEHDREDASALDRLLRHCAEHLDCAMAAISIPDANLTVSSFVNEADGASQLLDRTQKHLLAWAQLNNRPMVVNKISSSSETPAYKILSCPVRDQHSRVIGLIALFRGPEAEDFELRDVRILEFVSRKVVGILASQHDALTGLVNPLIFERRLQGILDTSAPATRALLYVDIDKLQLVNEAFGLQAGDEVIQRLAEVLRAIAGGTAIVSRVGGDRFALFLPAEDHPGRAMDVGRRILAAASQLGYVNGTQAVPVSASIGIAFATETGQRAPHLVAAAELACKRAKQRGRDRLEVFGEHDELMLRRRKQIFASESLQDALRNNEFRLEAQPIVGLRVRRGETVAFELLVRMHSQTGELIAPDKFFDAAERYDLLPALDRWVVCSAVDVLRRNEPDIARLDWSFTINVSAQSLGKKQFARFAIDQLAHAGLPPSAFCFEIKESAAVSHLPEAERLIKELSEAGCKIALDDFGCGLSSLAHLKRLPVQFLKIDGRFVRRILEDKVAESIVSGITKAARTLGVGTVAKHVESDALAEKLRELDVDFGQGFFLGRPRSLGAVFEEATAPTTSPEPSPSAAARYGGN